jgi:hypothetical protein
MAQCLAGAAIGLLGCHACRASGDPHTGLLNNPWHRRGGPSGGAEKPVCGWAALAPPPPGGLAAEVFQPTPMSSLKNGADPSVMASAAARSPVAISVGDGSAAGEATEAGLSRSPLVHSPGKSSLSRAGQNAFWPQATSWFPRSLRSQSAEDAGSLRNPRNRGSPADSARPRGACWALQINVADSPETPNHDRRRDSRGEAVCLRVNMQDARLAEGGSTPGSAPARDGSESRFSMRLAQEPLTNSGAEAPDAPGKAPLMRPAHPPWPSGAGWWRQPRG